MPQHYSGFDGSITVTDDDMVIIDFYKTADQHKRAMSPVRVHRSEIALAELIPLRGFTLSHIRLHVTGHAGDGPYNPKRDPYTVFVTKTTDVKAIRPLVDWLSGRRPELQAQAPRNADGSRRDISDAQQAMHTRGLRSSGLRTLEKRLVPGEIVEHTAAARSGGKAGLLVLTDQRLLFVYDGVVKRHTEEFALGTITAVNVKPGLILAKVEVVTGSGKLEVEQVPKADAEIVVNRIRQRMNGTVLAPVGTHRAPAAPGALTKPSTAPVDVTHQLSQLADLRDRGVLTDAEFAAQKAKLLQS